jgi:hypothetical protein
LVYQLNRRISDLSHLCVTWQAQVHCINVDMPWSWGPSQEDLLQALASERQAGGNKDFMDVFQDGGDEDEDEYDDPDSGDEEYGDLIYASEVSAIADAYHESCESSHELLGLFTNSSSTLPISTTSRKRVRFSDNYHI